MEIIAFGFDRGIGEDTGGFLEGSSGEERIGLKRGLGDAKDERLADSWALASEDRFGVFSGEAVDGDASSWKHSSITTIDDDNLAEHLTDDDFEVLIGDVDTLGAIDLLDFLEHVDFEFLDVGIVKQLLRVDGTFGDLATTFDIIADFHAEVRAIWGRVGVGFKIVGDRNLIALVLRDNRGDVAGDLRDHGLAFWITGFNKFLDTWKTGSDVASCHTTSVEDSHGELGTRFTDGLGGHDTNGFADGNKFASGHVLTIAMTADAVAGLTGEDSADLNFLDAGIDDFLCGEIVNEGIRRNEDFASLWIDDVMHRVASDETFLEGADDNVAAGITDLTNLEAMVAMAIVFADDDILGDVDKTTGEVTRVCGLKRGIGRTLTGTVGVDEELGDLHTFMVGGDDWELDFFVLRVGD